MHLSSTEVESLAKWRLGDNAIEGLAKLGVFPWYTQENMSEERRVARRRLEFDGATTTYSFGDWKLLAELCQDR